MLIYLGSLILLVNFHFLYEDEATALFLIGLGAAMARDYLAGEISHSARSRSPAKLIFGLLFLLVGGHYYYEFADWWPGILILIGIFLIWRGSTRSAYHSTGNS